MEKENILKAVGIKVEYGEELNEGEYRGTFRTVSDSEHAEMVKMYIEENHSYEKIAEQFHRSSRTPLLHIQKHNRAIERSGFFSVCKRIGSKHFREMIEKKPCLSLITICFIHQWSLTPLTGDRISPRATNKCVNATF